MISLHCVLVAFFFSCTVFLYPQKCQKLHTVYGIYTIDEPIVLDVLNSSSMQRLKHINQYGVSCFIKSYAPYTRYDHSIGVFALLRRFGASLPEQVIGLLHDVSHTVFSHVGDHFSSELNNEIIQKKESYQDDIHTWFLCNTELEAVLVKHGLSVRDVNPKNKHYCMFDQELPDLCADRLEYNLFGGFIEEKLSQADINNILAHLHFQNGVWFFNAVEQAKKLALISLYLTEYNFATPWNILTYEWTAQALQRAVAIQELTWNDIHFSTDNRVWCLLLHSNDSVIRAYMRKICKAEDAFMISDEYDYDMTITAKFRGINPWVNINGRLERLTVIDADFKEQFERVKKLVTNRRYIKFNF